jgi:hypothetical protein
VRALVLVSDAHASLLGPGTSHDGDGEVRELDLESAGGRVRIDLHASTGGVVALWVVSASD